MIAGMIMMGMQKPKGQPSAPARPNFPSLKGKAGGSPTAPKLAAPKPAPKPAPKAIPAPKPAPAK